MAIEIAWAWLRFQPESELSKWYERRFGHGSKRLRKIGIVALARKLLIELFVLQSFLVGKQEPSNEHWKNKNNRDQEKSQD